MHSLVRYAQQPSAVPIFISILQTSQGGPRTLSDGSKVTRPQLSFDVATQTRSLHSGWVFPTKPPPPLSLAVCFSLLPVLKRPASPPLKHRGLLLSSEGGLSLTFHSTDTGVEMGFPSVPPTSSLPDRDARTQSCPRQNALQGVPGLLCPAPGALGQHSWAQYWSLLPGSHLACHPLVSSGFPLALLFPAPLFEKTTPWRFFLCVLGWGQGGCRTQRMFFFWPC